MQKLPYSVPKLRDVKMGCWTWIGVLVGGIEVWGCSHGVLRLETVN